MSAPIYKKLAVPFSNLWNLNNLCHTPCCHLQFIQHAMSSYTVVIRPFSSATAGEQNQSFVSSYLINSCGLSPDRAKIYDNILKFDSSEKPDSVISFFRNQGFANEQISKMLRLSPQLLCYNPEKVLLPKIKFFRSMGFSKEDCAEFFSKHPSWLKFELEKGIIPLCTIMRNVLKSDRKVLATMKRSSWNLHSGYRKNAEGNIEILRDVGVPQSSIAFLLCTYPKDLFMERAQFSKLVHEVRELGFDVSKTVFVKAIHALTSPFMSTRERCVEVYKEWGWSEDDIRSAFLKNPLCMNLSEDKLRQTLEFLVNKMGYQTKEIAKHPGVLLFSLKKRTIPRCSVIRALTLMEFEDKELSLTTICTKGKFLERFVNRHLERAPQLLRIYNGETDVFGSDFAKLLKVKQV